MQDENPEQTFPAITELPDVSPQERWYLECFSKLESSRQVGMATGAIPLSEILYYKQYLDEDEEFVDYIMFIDTVWLEENSKKT